MIKSLELSNFRGFKDNRVTLTPFCLLVGQNNAGKTTIIEALRIISIAQARAPMANFQMAPEYLSEHLTGPVYRLSLSQLGFEHRTAHHRYESGDPAIISAVLKNNCRIRIYIGEEEGEVFCQLVEAGVQKVLNRSHSSNPKFDRVIVMPPVGQLVVKERRLSEDYLKKNLNSHLAYRHIRNQMLDSPDDFKTFQELVESSWSKLQVKQITIEQSDGGTNLSLQVRDGPFVSEVGLQGSGLQAWLKALWFLSRVGKIAALFLMSRMSIFMQTFRGN